MNTVDEFKTFVLTGAMLSVGGVEAATKYPPYALHHTLGTYMRNNWHLWEQEEKKKNELVKFFNSQGIYHADDMSSMILESLSKLLVDKNADIEFDRQVRMHKEFWTKQGYKDGICLEGNKRS